MNRRIDNLLGHGRQAGPWPRLRRRDLDWPRSTSDGPGDTPRVDNPRPGSISANLGLVCRRATWSGPRSITAGPGRQTARQPAALSEASPRQPGQRLPHRGDLEPGGPQAGSGYRRIDNPFRPGQQLGDLGLSTARRGDLSGPRSTTGEALEIDRRSTTYWPRLPALGNLGLLSEQRASSGGGHLLTEAWRLRAHGSAGSGAGVGAAASSGLGEAGGEESAARAGTEWQGATQGGAELVLARRGAVARVDPFGGIGTLLTE
jgi:hypothetical protein